MIAAHEPERRQRTAIMLALFMVSGAGLAFEIALTRIFSLFFQYHFAFLAVSLAVLGLSLGAAWGHFRTRRSLRSLAQVLVVLSAAFPATAAFLAWYPFAGSVLPRAAAALVPFFLIGLFATLTFERLSSLSGTLYGADLLGAAAGVLAVLALLSVASAFSVVLILGVATGAAALGLVAASPDLRSNRRLAGAAAAVGAAGLALLATQLATGVVDFDPARLEDVTRDKTMLQILNDPAQDARIVRTAWSPFARVDVVETRDASSKYIFTDGGAGSFMLRYDGTLESIAGWRESIDYLPFAAGPTADTLIIGAGGGKDIALALLGGAQAITAVEVNPAVIEATRAFADYNGGILDLPQVRLIEGDARAFVEREDDQYDLIYLNLVYTQAAGAGSQALIENYIFTWQAFQTYLERLRPGGRLAVVSHNALEASRAAITALRAFEAQGIPPAEALDHLMVWMRPASDVTLRTSVLWVSRDPLDAPTIETVSRQARQLGMQSLFTPGEFELAFQPLRDGMSLQEFTAEDAGYDLTPTSDDSPYFFQLDPGLPRPVQSALVTALVLALGLLIFAFLSPDLPARKLVGWIRLVIYAALIGAGFMLIEIPLIQRFQLLLGQPALSLVAVLGTLLLAGGAGSLLSQRWRTPQLAPRVALAGVWIAGLALVYRFGLGAVSDALLGQPLAVRLLAVMVLTALLGLPMGLPFPSLMRVGGQVPQRVALLWAVNGVFSVAGSVAAVVISMTWGFGWTLLAGALLYLALALLARTVEFG